jgi:surface adhesion protein
VSTTITGATGGNFENLVPTRPGTTTVTDTIDTTNLSLSATGTAEGGSIVYTATLTNPAGTPVTVTLSNGGHHHRSRQNHRHRDRSSAGG